MIPAFLLPLAAELGKAGFEALMDWLRDRPELAQEPMRSVALGDLVVVLGVVGDRTVGRVTSIHSVDVIDVSLIDHRVSCHGLVRDRTVNGWNHI